MAKWRLTRVRGVCFDAGVFWKQSLLLTTRVVAPRVQQQTLPSSPWFGALKAYLPARLLLLRIVSRPTSRRFHGLGGALSCPLVGVASSS